jgi:mono/diheme cytochrome c family protein
MIRPAVLLLPFALFSLTSAQVFAADPVDFGREILPILSDNCFQCHGPDAKARKAELRLDTEAGALRKADPVMIPGKSGESEVIRRLLSTEKSKRMPPPKTGRTLTARQITVLRQWIDEGAKWGKHWAFEKPRRPALPVVRDTQWPRNPLDHFILARLKQEGLNPSPEASRATLIRRVTLDLTGLPPTPQQVDAVLADDSPDWYEKLVDRLMASPHYGERMVWEWLDAARYADSNGYQGDGERTMWPWRDWAVDAINRNLPFDEFTIWQLAGDLLPNATFQQKLATAFCRNHMINGEGGRIPEENRVDYVMDMAETTGTVWLGLTFNCCRCHDHKFDALTQRDYYSLFAFFNQTPVNGGGGDPATKPVLEVIPKLLTLKPVRVMVMEDMAKPRETFILSRGNYEKPGEKVTAAIPAALPAAKASNRLDLARWLVTTDNPLTARVTVNRAWMQFFGTGLVKTPEDFGVQGEKPSHPDLLDWLACEFRSNWDVKALHRLIVTSATYRQSSKVTPALHERDPQNRLLASGPRFRLPSWMIRDQALAASGLLARQIGGPPVNPYQPPGVWEEATFGGKRYQQDHGDALHRRSVYTFWRRIIGPTPFFDTAPRQTCVVKPTRTNSPLHALTTLNDVTYVEAARALAERVLTAVGPEPEPRLDLAFRLVLARQPNSEEKSVLLAALARLRREFADDPTAAKKLLAVGESKRNDKLDVIEHAAWTALATALLNLDETLTRE